jgi:hypothetical protein
VIPYREAERVLDRTSIEKTDTAPLKDTAHLLDVDDRSDE